MISAIKELREKIAFNTLGTTIEALRALAVKHNIAAVMPRIAQTAENYDLMQRYLLQGYDDEQRSQLLLRMKEELYSLTFEAQRQFLLRSNHTLSSTYEEMRGAEPELSQVENELLAFDQQLSMASLEAGSDEKKNLILDKQFDYRRRLFNSLLIRPLLTDDEARLIEKTILSPLIDTIDRQIMVSAMSLAQQLMFDARKFALLCWVYDQTDDEHARQLALIGIVSALPTQADIDFGKKHFLPAFSEAFFTTESLTELAQLQCQMIISLDTMKADRKIEREILPTLRSHAERMSKEMSEGEDPENLLNPHLEEDAMEEVEKAMNRMRKMKEAGVDVFFGGFSKAKRFSFFYTLVNWFIPFYIDHPQLRGPKSDILPRINNLLETQAMCSSDKYSFMFSLMTMMKSLPKELRNTLNFDLLPKAGDIEKDLSPMEVRQLHLQDLYRFYNLYPFKADFENRLDDELTVCFFAHPLISTLFEIKLESKTMEPDKAELVVAVARQLCKRNRLQALESLLWAYDSTLHAQLQEFRAVMLYKQEHYKEAFPLLIECCEAQPQNRKIYEIAADTAYMTDNYAEAEALYAQMMENEGWVKHPDDINYRIALCQLEQGNTQQALSNLYRLYYDHEHNQRVITALAAAQLQLSKAEEALQLLGRIEGEPTNEAIVCRFLACALLHRYSEAVEALRQLRTRKAYDRRKLSLFFESNKHRHKVLQTAELQILIDLAFL